MGGCALRHARVSGCTLDGARGARQGAGEVRGDSSERWWRSGWRHPTGKRHVGLLEGETGQGQTGEREGVC